MDEVLFMLHMKFLRNSLTAVTLFLLSAALNAAETTAPKADKYRRLKWRRSPAPPRI